MSEQVIVIITAANEEEASEISMALVNEGLVACANRFPVNSTFIWKTNLETADEVMLVCKTRAELLTAIIFRVKEIHSYDCPEIIALPILGGAADYLDWIKENTISD